MKPDQIDLLAVRRPRQGWADAFKAMTENGDDQLLDEAAMNQPKWDEDEWRW